VTLNISTTKSILALQANPIFANILTIFTRVIDIVFLELFLLHDMFFTAVGTFFNRVNTEETI
jgi:hypothetical protein